MRARWALLACGLALFVAAPAPAQQRSLRQRKQEARRLAGALPSPERDNRLLELLREDPHVAVRQLALGGLSPTDDEACLRAFAAALAEDPSPVVRGEAALCLARDVPRALGAWEPARSGEELPAWLDEAILPTLLAAVRSSAPRVQLGSIAALRSLARLARVAPLLRRRIADPLDRPSFVAAAALAEAGQLTPGLIARVERALSEPGSPAPRRREASRVLALLAIRGDSEVVLPALLRALAKDGDARVRQLAAVALGRAGRAAAQEILGGPEIAAGLARAGQEDPAPRVRAEALGGIGFLFVPLDGSPRMLRGEEAWDAYLPLAHPPSWYGAQVVPTVRAGLADPAPAVRASALESLAALGPFARPLLGRLPPILSDDEQPDLVTAALRALTQLGGHAAPAADAVRPFLSDPDPERRVMACKVLTQVGQHDAEVQRALAPLLGDWEYELEALEVLIEAGPRAAWAVPELRRLLRGEPFNLSPIVRALRGVGPAARPAIPELLPLLTQEAGEPPELAALLLAELRVGAAVEPLRELVESRASTDLGAVAAGALATIGSAARPALPAIRALAADPEVAADHRALAQVARARLGEVEPALAELRELLARGPRHECSELSEVWLALPQLGASLRPLLPTLRPLLRCRCAPHACELIAALGPPAAPATPDLLRLLDPEQEACAEAVRALGRIGAPEAGAPILPLLDSKRPEVRGAAAEALGRLGARPARPKLRERLEDAAEVPYVLERARAALTRLERAEPGPSRE